MICSKCQMDSLISMPMYCSECVALMFAKKDALIVKLTEERDSLIAAFGIMEKQMEQLGKQADAFDSQLEVMLAERKF